MAAKEPEVKAEEAAVDAKPEGVAKPRTSPPDHVNRGRGRGRGHG